MDTMGEQFCLKWNNHQTTLISIFDTLLDSGNHVDCCLAAEGKSLNAHKVILSACSPYLEYLLNQHQDKYPVLVFSDLKFHELKAMLEYMYRGEVNVAQEQLNGFLKAAEALQIKGLTDQGGGGSGGGTSSGGSGEPEMGGGMPPKRKQLSRDEHISQEMAPDCGSMSPSGGTAKRRRQRRTSQDQSIVPPIVPPDSHPDTSSNSCDILPPAVSSSPAASLVTKPKIETDRLSAASSTSSIQQPPPQSPMLVKEKIEPPDLIQPKAEYLDDPSDDHIEDLTLDDDDDDDSYMAKPGSSHAPDSQGYDSSWQYSADTSNPPDMFLGSQDPAGNQNNSQEWWESKKDVKLFTEDVVSPKQKPLDDHYNLSVTDATPSLLLEPVVPSSPDPTSTCIKCRLCGYQAVNKRILDVHMTTHMDGETRHFMCPYCDYRAARKSHLATHVMVKHARDGLIECSLCSYKAPHKRHLDEHMLKHISVDQRPHKCPHCDYRATKISNLNGHVRLKHTREGLITCSVCSHQAVSKWKLDKHMLKHRSAKDRPHKCTYCEYRANDKSCLDRHVRLKHTREGLISCSLCKYQAAQKSAMARHVVKHMSADDRPHSCPHCDHRATQKCNLNTHIRNKHKRKSFN